MLDIFDKANALWKYKTKSLISQGVIIKMNYPNLPNSVLEFKSQPEVKETTNELLK
ncbi:hypothetical protein HpCK101_20720 [Helicobacter pylori]